VKQALIRLGALLLAAFATSGYFAGTPARADLPAGNIELSYPSNGQTLTVSQTVYSSAFQFAATYYYPFPGGSARSCYYAAQLAGPGYLSPYISYGGSAFCPTGPWKTSVAFPRLASSTPLRPGNYSWTAFLLNQDNSVVAHSTAFFTVIADPIPAPPKPDPPVITSSPRKVTTDTEATFTFTSSARGYGWVGYRCYLSAYGQYSRPTRCWSPMNFIHIPVGQHRFDVYVEACKDSSLTNCSMSDAASYSWTVEPYPSRPSTTPVVNRCAKAPIRRYWRDRKRHWHYGAVVGYETICAKGSSSSAVVSVIAVFRLPQGKWSTQLCAGVNGDWKHMKCLVRDVPSRRLVKQEIRRRFKGNGGLPYFSCMDIWRLPSKTDHWGGTPITGWPLGCPAVSLP
jgi:hypothetical protein